MTQSKDGMGRNPGTATRSPGQRSPETGPGTTIELPMLPHPSAVSSPSPSSPATDTDEMQDLLRKIASQIAEAEQRQGAALDGMQSRLSDLTVQTESVKSEAPKELQSGLDSIETRIAEIAESVEAAGREIKTGGPASAVATVAGPSGPSSNMHVRGFGRGQVRGSNDMPPTAKKVNADKRTLATPASAAPEAGGPWDQEAADALAKIFSDEEEAATTTPSASTGAKSLPTPAKPAIAPHSPALAVQAPRPTLDPSKPSRPEPPALASANVTAAPAKSLLPPAGGLTGGPTSAPRTAPPAVPVKPAQQPLPSATSFSRTPAPFVSATAAGGQPAPAIGASAPPAPTGNAGTDREWLNSRFAEIAAQIERSLKESRPERALSALGQRFDKLESSLATVMTAVRSGTEQGAGQGASQALQTLDSQVSGLKMQVDAAVQRLERLDALKGEISSISQRLGALDRLEQAQIQVAAQLSGTRSDIDHLARAFDQQKASGAGTGSGLAGDQAAADPRIAVLQELMESQINERREGEAATVTVLQAIQGAIDQFTHRMGEFEEAVAAAVLGGIDQQPGDQLGHLPPNDRHAAPTVPAGESRHAHGLHHPQTLQGAPHQEFGRQAAVTQPAIEEPMVPPSSSRGRGSARVEATRRGPADEAAQAVETSIPRTRRGIGNIIGSGSVSPAPGSGDGDAPTRAGRRVDPAANSPGREDMLGTARRAASQVAEDGDDPEVDVEAIAARLPGQKRPKPKAARGGFFTFEKAGTRPILVVGLVALMAAGAGMLYGTLADRSQPLPVRIEKPKAPLGKVGAVQPIPAPQLADARAREMAIISGANSEPGMDSTDDPIRAGANERGTSEETDVSTAADMRAADLNEAALSVLKPSTDTEAAPLHTSSSLTPARNDGQGITTGILIDSGAPMPSARDLKRYSDEQRMARISSQLGDKAVQKTEREHASPASHTPDAVRPNVLPEQAPTAAATASANAGGLPPAQVGPMSLRVAAAKGDPSAEFEVASRFAQGRGVPKDFAKAAEWYQRAASRGSAPAQYRLGGLYERGIGVKADPARARAWYKRAADLGNVKAMHNLAVMHTQRDAGEPDYASASQWFSKAANHGLSDSQFNLAILHENGMGVPKSMTEAYKWYALAAERGDPEAAKRRNAISSRLTPADIEKSRLVVAKWRPQMTEPSANDPMLAGQAWRNRHGEEQIGGQSEAPQGSAAVRPATMSSASTGQSSRREPQESEIIDLSSATIDAQMKAGSGAANATHNVSATQSEISANPAGPAEQQAIMNRKRKVTKVQSSGDVEKLLTQFGYNPAALKKARPGAPEETPATSAQAD